MGSSDTRFWPVIVADEAHKISPDDSARRARLLRYLSKPQHALRYAQVVGVTVDPGKVEALRKLIEGKE